MNNFVPPIKRFWYCLISVGLTSAVDEKEAKYIKFTNVVALLTAMSVVAYIPFSLFRGYYILGLLQSIDTVFVLTVLLFNHLGYHKTARHLYIFVINSFVLINSCFIGFDSRVHDFFYIAYIVPFLLFSVKDYKNIVAGVLTSIIFFNIYEVVYPHFVQYNLDATTQHMIYSINLWMKFVLFGVAIYILSYYNYSTETELALSNKKLEEQAEELKRSNNDLEQFAAIISHDLNAPVRNVSSLMDLLLRRYRHTMDAEAVNVIELSRDSTERMGRQIDDLLSYSKLGRNLPPAGPVDVSSLIATIQIELGEKIRAKKAVIIVENQMPVITHVHGSMMHHIFQNLISNGIKFNTNIKPEVRISCKLSGNNYLFSVRDNGIGIDDIYMDKLFHMFKRLHTDAEFEGTGIGLAVCKKIIDFYGGSIWLESEKGRGTYFYFTIPRRKSPPVQLYNAKFTMATAPHSTSMA